MSDKRTLSDIIFARQARRIWRKLDDKAPPWVMLRPWSDSRPPTSSMTKLPPPIRARRPSPCPAAVAPAAAPGFAPTNPLLQQAFRLGRGRRTRRPSAPTRASRRLSSPAPGSLCSTKFFATDPPFAGALRQRLALARRRPPAPPWRAIARILPRCATPSIFRPTPAGTRPPAPPAASIGCGAVSPRPFAARRTDAAQRRRSFWTSRTTWVSKGWPRPCGTSRRRRKIRWRRPRARATPRMKLLRRAARRRRDFRAVAERSCLARTLGWDAPVPLLATTIARPSSRSAARQAAAPGRRRLAAPLRPAVALAAREAHGLAGELSRRSAKLLSVAPKLSAKGAGRVIEMLLADDAVSPATAAKVARLSDRASPAFVRSAGRARRRARIVRAAEFSALRPIGFSRKVGTGSREENASRKECEARSWAVRKDASKNRCSIPSWPTCRRALVGANGWVGWKRRSLLRPTPVPREALARLVGKNCNLDDLLADIRDELRARPYELVQVAGGWQLRTKARYADAIRALNNGARDAGPPELTPTELLTVTAIAYLQPATRAELSRLVGKEVSRDIIGRLKVSISSPPARARRNPALPMPMSRRGSFWRCLVSLVCVICPTSKSWRMPACCNVHKSRPISMGLWAFPKMARHSKMSRSKARRGTDSAAGHGNLAWL